MDTTPNDHESADYHRGVAAGGIEARLADHDRHFALINGNLIRVAENSADQTRALNALTLAVQRLADQAEADARTAVATAKALKEANEARRSEAETRRAASEQTWTPWQRLIAVVGGLVSVTILIGVGAALLLR